MNKTDNKKTKHHKLLYTITLLSDKKKRTRVYFIPFFLIRLTDIMYYYLESVYN